MKPLRPWMWLPRNLTALFLAVAALAVVALVWLGVRLLEQDRALEAQRLEERRESAADRVVAALEQTLTAEDRKLADLRPETGRSAAQDVLWIKAGHQGLQAWPERALLYYPALPPVREASPQLYLAGEKAEFIDRNHERAVETFRALTASADPAVKAGAQLRLARNLRKLGRYEAALEVYEDLAGSAGVTLSGAPAELVARRARCAVLEELGRSEQLRLEAQGLYESLRSGRWQLDRASYLHYSHPLERWLKTGPSSDTGRQALAGAVDWLWRHWQTTREAEPDSSGRRSLHVQGTPVTVIWQASFDRLEALAAGPRYQQLRWFEPALRALDLTGVQVALLDAGDNLVHGPQPAAGSPQTRRVASVTGLPWTVAVSRSDTQADLGQFAQRRRLMLGGLVTLAVLVVAGSYLIARGVSRELAVARLQSDFVSAVSHEFRTPLTSLHQFTEILVEDDDLPVAERRSFYEALARATRRLTRLVESLLDFGRMEAGARPYRLEPLDAAQFAAAVAAEFRQEVSAQGFLIECHTPAGAVPVRADKDALAQALWNLLDNAVKYSGDSRTVRLEVERNEEVIIRVRDQGLGIPASEQKQVLRKFVRGSAAKACGIKGTGIGLTIVRHIVEAHGGRLALESEPGKGSTFTILLPIGG